MMKPAPPIQSWLEFRFVIRVLLLVVLVGVAIGAIMSWVLFFQSYDKTFAELRAAELRLAQEVYNETNSRILADMLLMQTEASINASLILDIATREAEQAFVNESLQMDIVTRETVDALIAMRLAQEIAERMGNDTLLAYEIGNLTAIIEVIEAFDMYSSQQFAIISGNTTTVSEGIYAEIAARIAAQAALAAADAIIEGDLVLLISELSAEVAARIAQQALINQQLHLITTSLLLTIDGQQPIANNMVFQSLSASIVIANGMASNEIILTQTALWTIAGVGGDLNGNLGIVAGNGLSIAFPSANTIEIVYSGPIPPTPMNYVRTIAVYPHGSTTCEVQGQGGGQCVNMLNGFFLIPCSVDANCMMSAVLGSEWTCQGGFFSSFNNHRCVNNACSDESQCYDILGQPWHCRGGKCVMDWCSVDTDCEDAHGQAGWHCVNYVCVRALPNSPFRPTYVDSYPDGSGPFQYISQPLNNQVSPCANCIFPQPGAYNDVGSPSPYSAWSAYPLVIGNRRPYDPAPIQIPDGMQCLFDNQWAPGSGNYCGFYMPASGGTFVVQVTINIRIGLNQPGTFYPKVWFYMHLDRSGASPPQWERVDADTAMINNLGVNPTSQFYISMTSTVIASSTVPIGSGNAMAPGTFLYAGWSAYWPDDNPASEYAAWYSIIYDITQVA
jgi:hypothetical protein